MRTKFGQDKESELGGWWICLFFYKYSSKLKEPTYLGFKVTMCHSEPMAVVEGLAELPDKTLSGRSGHSARDLIIASCGSSLESAAGDAIFPQGYLVKSF